MLGDCQVRHANRVLLVLLATVAGCLTALVVADVIATGGHFTYSLDDPYIHLALADGIADGSYGLNPGEPSSPSSSILWPFLLAAFAHLPAGDLWPLAVNGLCTLATSVFIFVALRRSVTPNQAALIAGVLVVALNVVGVALTGMEHSLQVLLATMVAAGVLALVDEDSSIPAYLMVGMVVGPLVRYELAAFSVAAAIVLIRVGHVRRAAVATAAWVSVAGLFSLYLWGLGLDPLPSSILAKSQLSNGSLPEAVAGRIGYALEQPGFLLCVVVLLLDLAIRQRWTLLHTFASIVLFAHAVAGDFGWLGRYEVYLYVGLAPILVRFVVAWLRSTVPIRVLAGLACVAAAVAAIPLARTSVQSPLAARDIWSQQAQTAAFVRDEWQLPIAVNDLGLVAYRGDQQVLDLWGLANQAARRDRLTGNDPDWMNHLVRGAGIRLVAIYTDWFSHVPGSWTLVGHITGAKAVSSAERSVDFYVVDIADAAMVCAELIRFDGQTESRWTDVSCVYDPA
jgi:hypothetical protein